MYRRLIMAAMVAAVAIVAVGARAGGASAQTVPVVRAVSGGPYGGTAGVPVTFNGNGSTGYGAILSFRWDFGDGAAAFGSVAAHTYAVPGNYPVTLTVTGQFGQVAVNRTIASIGTAAPVFGVSVSALPAAPLAGGSCVLTVNGYSCAGAQVVAPFTCGVAGVVYAFCPGAGSVPVTYVQGQVVNASLPLSYWCGVPTVYNPYAGYCGLVVR